MSETWHQVANEADIPSPALLLYRERAEMNIRQMLRIAGDPARLWPHVKTHKMAPLVKAQLALGISSFKCATVAEAEMTATAGASRVLLAYQPVGPGVGRLLELIRRFPQTEFLTIVDSPEVVGGLGAAAQAAGAEISVLLDLDCGMGRTGIAPGAEAARLYGLIGQTRGLAPGGLHAYDGHLHEADLAVRRSLCEAAFAAVLALREELEKSGQQVPRLVAGGTPTFAIHAECHDRYLSPGTSVLWDFGYGDKFPDLPFFPAAALLTRVVSKPCSGRLCLDLGHKAVAAENPPPRVRLLELPNAVAVMHSEEHLVIETERAHEFKIGQCLYGLPRHICPTVALHNEAWIVESGAAGETWPVAARGRKITI